MDGVEDGGATEGLGIDDLPEEVLLLMLSFLPPGCLVRLSLLSQRWHALLNDPTLWRLKLAEHFPKFYPAALQKLHTVIGHLPMAACEDEEALEKRLDEEWCALCKKLGYGEKHKTAEESIERLELAMSDLRILYRSETGEEEDDEEEDDAPEMQSDSQTKSAESGDPGDVEAGASAAPEKEQANSIKNEDSSTPSASSAEEIGQHEETDKAGKSHNDWRLTCLSLLVSEKNWYRGNIRPIQRLPASADVLCLDFDEERQLLVIGNKSGSRGDICVRNLRTGQQIFAFQGHRWWVNDLHLRGDLLFSCSNDATITVWDLKSVAPIKVMQSHGAGVQSIGFHPQLPHIMISGSWDNSVKLWDVGVGELLDTFPFAPGQTLEQAWAVGISDKGMLLGAGQAGWLCAWDYRSRTPVFAHQPEEMNHSIGTFRYRTGFHSLQFNETGERCIVAGSQLPLGDASSLDIQRELSGIIQEYDFCAGHAQCLRTFKGTSANIRSIQYDHSKLVAGDFESRIKVWDLDTGSLRTNFNKPLPVSFDPSTSFDNRIFKIKYSPSGLLVTGESNSVGIWDVSGRRKPHLTSWPLATPPTHCVEDDDEHY